MNYFSTQSIQLIDVLTEGRPAYRVLVAEPEDELYGIYARHLREHRFAVYRSEHLHRLEQFIAEHEPHLVLVSLHFPEGSRTVLEALRAMRNSRPSLHIVSIGSAVDPNTLKSILSSGASSHIDRRYSRPHDIAHIAKTILLGS
jgi:CheY-like chemotaxis protein